MPTSFDGNNPPFLEWTSEVRGSLQLNDFAFMTNLDATFNEVHSVTLNDIYGGRDGTEAIGNGIRRHQAGLAALNEEYAQRDQLLQMVNQHDEEQQPSAQTLQQSQVNVTISSPDETTSGETSTRPLSISHTSWCIQQSPTVKQTIMCDNSNATKMVLKFGDN